VSQGQSETHGPTSPRAIVKYEKLEKQKRDGMTTRDKRLMSFIFTPKV
jgi:hypothetical protein